MGWAIKSDSEYDKANTVNLRNIFNYYNLYIDTTVNSVCPFHKDYNPSFKYYANTNSFYCFSCKSGGGPIDFVSKYTNCDKQQAVNLLLNNFEIDANYTPKKTINAFKICADFSNAIRAFIVANKTNSHALKHAEYISNIFDELRFKHKLDYDALCILSSKLKSKLEEFKNYDSDTYCR